VSKTKLQRTHGQANSSNVPGGRDTGVTWIDPAGNLWLFGGEGLGGPFPGCGCNSTGGFLADLWRYDPRANVWTWMSGSSLGSAAGGARGVYGTQGVPAASNAPGHRIQAVSWTDPAGNLWLFGGNGFDSNGNEGQLNDLWKYDTTNGQWAWMSGSPIGNAPAVYGTQGVPAANVPDARQLAISWADKDSNLLLFGGSAESGNHNDLWQYTIGTGEWTWMSGSSGVNAPGIYGTLGPPAVTNVPGARAGGVSWIDASGKLWHFGGNGVDSGGVTDLLNDLWAYQR